MGSDDVANTDCAIRRIVVDKRPEVSICTPGRRIKVFPVWPVRHLKVIASYTVSLRVPRLCISSFHLVSHRLINVPHEKSPPAVVSSRVIPRWMMNFGLERVLRNGTDVSYRGAYSTGGPYVVGPTDQRSAWRSPYSCHMSLPDWILVPIQFIRFNSRCHCAHVGLITGDFRACLSFQKVWNRNGRKNGDNGNDD